ncbi:myosin-like protein [Phytophthora infestans T30-4]|uniref:Myosin-like protein n=1 Tax=Phytophthora infestans (strain T30-4) TaxID=403677 RepID=D0N401_PHYIT|nr:myosin-like protein [Phytophthora infestans T30-4]EEY69105.1 myosin-like protein [Phytophthora infestans T30-4]|eukprot:XP_002998959.1 myosin-like protein [Phytophthora infestans T30-4]
MRGDQRTDMSLMTFGGKTNAVLELGKRLIQPEEEWKDKCAAFTELRALLSDASLLQSKLTDAPETAAVEDCTSIFTIENVQALTQPFRVTLTDLRSTVVKEACATLSHLAQALGPLRCKILVRDVFPTLLDARGGSNKVNTAAIHSCIEAIMQSTPSRFVLAPVLQVLNTSRKYIAIWPDEADSCDKKMTPPSSGSKVPSTLERLHRNDVPTPASGIPLPSLIPSTPTSALKKPREGRMPSKIPTPPRTTDLLEKETPTLEGKLSQLQEEKACLAKQITAQAHELHQLRGRIQKMNEEKQLSESRHKVAMAATMKAHAQDSATQQDIQYKLAEQLGAQEEELEELRSQHSQSSSPTQTTPQTPDHVAHLENELSLLSEQLEVATSKLETSSAEAGGEMNALRSQKCALEERLSAQSMQLEELQAKQSATVAALEEEKRMLADEVSSLKNIEMEVMARCNEKDDRVAQLESELSLLSEQLEVATSKLETSSAEAGGEMNALRSEKCALEERLSAQSMQLEELQAKQSATVAALEEEKRMLADEVSSLKNIETEVMARCNEKDDRVAQLESELSLLSEQLEVATSKLETSSAEAGGEMNALRSEKCALEERLSAQSMQLEELQAKQSATVAALEEEKRMLADEVSSLKNIETEVMARCNEKDDRVAQLESELSLLSEQLEVATSKLETSSAEAGGEMNALRSQKCALEERLSAQSMQLEELQAKQSATVAALEEEKRMLADEVSSLKNIETEVMARCNEKDDRVAQLESERTLGVGAVRGGNSKFGELRGLRERWAR